jgi:hypothetical protein
LKHFECRGCENFGYKSQFTNVTVRVKMLHTKEITKNQGRKPQERKKEHDSRTQRVGPLLALSAIL